MPEQVILSSWEGAFEAGWPCFTPNAYCLQRHFWPVGIQQPPAGITEFSPAHFPTLWEALGPCLVFLYLRKYFQGSPSSVIPSLFTSSSILALSISINSSPAPEPVRLPGNPPEVTPMKSPGKSGLEMGIGGPRDLLLCGKCSFFHAYPVSLCISSVSWCPPQPCPH